MKKYNNIDYHSVSMSEFPKVLSDISGKDDFFMRQFTFVNIDEYNPHFRIEFTSILDTNSRICIYVDFPKIKINPFEVLDKMNLLYTDLQRHGFRYCYPEFETTKCETNEYQNSMD